jgi:predicted nucleic-acid-binding Zn-ribbon protein
MEESMADVKACPKCNGMMTQGRVLKHNEYVAGNQYMYVFVPDGDAAPDLSKLFSGKSSGKRKALVAFCCEQCGFTEFYGMGAG